MSEWYGLPPTVVTEPAISARPDDRPAPPESDPDESAAETPTDE
ncbi:MAG TPA: hypothetical protein VFI00_02330 [Kribbella sp.]|nr:hypothetical protein [Kribbella sp.]